MRCDEMRKRENLITSSLDTTRNEARNSFNLPLRLIRNHNNNNNNNNNNNINKQRNEFKEFEFRVAICRALRHQCHCARQLKDGRCAHQSTSCLVLAYGGGSGGGSGFCGVHLSLMQKCLHTHWDALKPVAYHLPSGLR